MAAGPGALDGGQAVRPLRHLSVVGASTGTGLSAAPEAGPSAALTPQRASSALSSPRPTSAARGSPAPQPAGAGPLVELSAEAVPVTFGEAPMGEGGHFELPQALRLEHNLALLAGAGAGKTHTLITLCLHLLSGARSHGVPIRPARLALVTFTAAAAAEMRDRLRLRVEALARGALEEPELLGTFEALGRPPPDSNFWRAVRDELGSASISTFHSLCIQLLRRAPEGSGINPAFGLLEDREARALLHDVVERELLEALAEPSSAALREATQELGLGRMVEGLAEVLTRIREEGLAPQDIPITHRPAALAAFEAARRGVLQALDDALAYDQNPKVQATARSVAPPLRRLTADNFLADYGPVAAALKDARGAPINLLKRRLRPAGSNDEPTPTLLEAWSSLHLCDAEAAVRALLTRLRDAHARALELRGVLDFTAQLVRARDLLRDHPEARRDAQGQFDALLVDEFQDTNRLQLELALLLAEQRASGPRSLTGVLTGGASDEVLALPLQRGFLCVVGDRKQSIYEFRGADVSVFEQMASRIEASGGGRAFLKVSRRSSPRLVGFFNALFPHVLAPPSESTPRPFEIAYQPVEDDLIAFRSDDDGAQAVERLTSGFAEQPSADALRLLDAEAVARAVARLVNGGAATVFDRQTQVRRPLRGSDVVLLFRNFTHVERYRAALVKAQVRHRLVGGRGFYGASEVRDLASLLALVADPADALSCAAVLRSPLVALSDASLVRVLVPGKGLDSQALLSGALSTQALPTEERDRLERFLALWPRLRRERDRLGVRALLEVAIDALELRAAFAAAPFGEQSLANLEKLLQVVAQRDAQGVGFSAVARELLLLAVEAPKEEQAEAVDALDVDAVTLMTVHKAKGLEWPVVVLPELFTRGQSATLVVRFDRDLGLMLSPWTVDGVELKTFRGREGRSESQRRSAAELQRLLYVAATRARDRVVLGLWGDKATAGSFAGLLAGPLSGNALVAAAACARVDLEELPAPTPASAAAPSPQDSARLEAAIARVRQAPVPRVRTVMLPVTALQDFVACPRRYRFAHLVGLAERPRALTWELEVPDAAVDARARGAAAHRLLELAPLELAGTAAFSPALQALAAREALVVEPEVFGWVSGFWSSAFGRAAAAAPERVHRELPFVLTLAEGDFTLHLRGQIDLLLEGEGGATVVDYKAARRPPQGLGAYRFQLGCYALAARHLLGARAGPVRAGISFLREEDRAPQLLSAEETEAAVEGPALVAAARALARAQVSGAFEGRAQPTCEALGCGYRYRCHPAG